MAEKIITNQADRSLVGEGKPGLGEMRGAPGLAWCLESQAALWKDSLRSRVARGHLGYDQKVEAKM